MLSCVRAPGRAAIRAAAALPPSATRSSSSIGGREQPADGDGPGPVLRVDHHDPARADHQVIDVAEAQELDAVHDDALASREQPLELRADQLLTDHAFLICRVIRIP
jgi:hypothetical protein